MMDWQRPKIGEENQVEIPENWLFLHYYDALSTLFRIENALRVFVYIILKKELQSEWKNAALTSEEKSKTTISALAKRRIARQKTFGYLCFPINSPLMHLTSGELVGFLTSDAYWQYFNAYFTASKSVVVLKLQEIGNVRNALAHFRPISEDDVEVVKQNAKQVLSGVEQALYDIIRCEQTVPTNTEEEWYEALHTLGTEEIKLAFSQTADGSWVRITLTHFPQIVSMIPKEPEKSVRYRLTKIETPDILKKYENLRTLVVFVTEFVPFYFRMPSDFRPRFQKKLRLTFSRQVLRDHHEAIKEDLENLLRQTSQETELLSDDQLAEGNILHLVNVHADAPPSEERRWWRFRIDALYSPQGPDHPDEYWGRLGATAKDFLSDTERYPWMPVKVSEERLPF